MCWVFCLFLCKNHVIIPANFFKHIGVTFRAIGRGGGRQGALASNNFQNLDLDKVFLKMQYMILILSVKMFFIRP